jgi:hypothetical protein
MAKLLKESKKSQKTKSGLNYHFVTAREFVTYSFFFKILFTLNNTAFLSHYKKFFLSKIVLNIF